MRQAQLFSDGVERGAVIDGPYRYALWREWTTTKPRLLWVMFNPSTADALEDDPTIRRCIDFSSRWGFGGLEVVNLYALRSPEPWHVLCHRDPVGPENDQATAAAIAKAAAVLAAWGSRIGPRHDARVGAVINQATRRGLSVDCLGQTFHGHPWHPLYVPAATDRKPFGFRSHA